MKLKAGDLVCYNAGGMKYKTLGLVIDLSRRRSSYGVDLLGRNDIVLIQWCIVGKIMPRREWIDVPWSNRREIEPGEFVWHEIGDWLEVVK